MQVYIKVNRYIYRLTGIYIDIRYRKQGISMVRRLKRGNLISPVGDAILPLSKLVIRSKLWEI